MLNVFMEVKTKTLTPEEAIGVTKRKDFPIITGKEVMIETECLGSKGQAFTDSPTVYKGTLKEISRMNIEEITEKEGFLWQQ
jgi:hypothetical protein